MPEPSRPADPSPQKSADIPGSNIQPQYVNRFQVLAGAGHVRFIFGDAAVGLDATYHSAIVMSLDDAISLSDLLVQMIKSQQPARFASGLSTAGSSQAISMGLLDVKKPT